MKVKIGKYAFNLTATRAYLLFICGLLLVPLVIGAFQSIPFYYQSTIKLEYKGQLYTFDSVVRCTPNPVWDIAGPTGGVTFEGGRVYPRFLAQELPDGRQLIVNNNKCTPAFVAFFRNRPEEIGLILNSYPQVYLANEMVPGAQVETYFGSISYNAPGAELKLISQTMRRASFFEQYSYAKNIEKNRFQLLSMERFLSKISCYELFEYSAEQMSKLSGVDFSQMPQNGLTQITDENSIGRMYPIIDKYMGDFHGFMDIRHIRKPLYLTAYPMVVVNNKIEVRSDLPMRGLCTGFSGSVYNATHFSASGRIELNYAGKNLELNHAGNTFYIYDSDIKKFLVGGSAYGSGYGL